MRDEETLQLFAKLVVRYGISVGDAKQLLGLCDEDVVYDVLLDQLFDEQFILREQLKIVPVAQLAAMFQQANRGEDSQPLTASDFIPKTERQRLIEEMEAEANAEQVWLDYIQRNAGKK